MQKLDWLRRTPLRFGCFGVPPRNDGLRLLPALLHPYGFAMTDCNGIYKYFPE
jgi:hypothetical protein